MSTKESVVLRIIERYPRIRPKQLQEKTGYHLRYIYRLLIHLEATNKIRILKRGWYSVDVWKEESSSRRVLALTVVLEEKEGKVQEGYQ
jgi:hypothetical protein